MTMMEILSIVLTVFFLLPFFKNNEYEWNVNVLINSKR
mgnify:CR=1 FL=1